MVNPVIKNSPLERRLYRKRLSLGLVFVFISIMILVARYAWLQIYHYNYYVGVSESNRIQLRPLAPGRGLVYARGGEPIAINLPSATLMIVPELVPNMDAVLAELRTMIDLEAHEIEDFLGRVKKSAPSAQVPLRVGLDEVNLARLAVNQHRLLGVELSEQSVRHYPYNNLFSHAVGYLGAINPEERRTVRRERKGAYDATYVIGKTGVELSYEDSMHGVIGFDYVEVNAVGHSHGLVKRERALIGDDLYLHLDVAVQRVARRAMGSRRGAVVALDVRNGGVVAMLSAPDFNPNNFVLGLRRGDMEAIQNSGQQPLFNRAISGRYAPASTLKPVVAMAALSGFIDKDFHVNDAGYYRLGGRVYYDWLEGGHGWVDMHAALVESCDTYFYHLGILMGEKPIVSMARRFGLGAPTNIDMFGESTGILPGDEWKRLYRGDKWYTGDTLNLSIGQGYTLVTPLQLAVMTMGLANRGKRWVPRLVRAVGDVVIEPQVAHDTMLSDDIWRDIHAALEGVVNEPKGTAHMIANGLDYGLAGKTGTAQIISLERQKPEEGEVVEEDSLPVRPQQATKELLLRDHAVFVGYAPADNPTLAVAVVVENGEFGGMVAGPIARAIFDTWLQKGH